MKPDARFQALPKSFWAYVRSISEWVGYTDRATRKIKVPSSEEMSACLHALELAPKTVVLPDGRLTELGRQLDSYFTQRADVLNTQVEPSLMRAPEAAALFGQLRKELKSTLRVPMNKQKGKKKKPAYLTGMVGMLVEAHRGSCTCDYDPRILTAFTKADVLKK